MGSTAQDLSSKDQPLQEDAFEDLFNLDPAEKEKFIEPEEKDIMDLYPAELKELLDYNHVDVEIRERIYEEFNEIKMFERKEMGWNKVHNEIEDAPFCEKRQIITKVCYCRNCASCHINGSCYECLKKGENHYLDFPYPTFETYNKNFQEFY